LISCETCKQRRKDIETYIFKNDVALLLRDKVRDIIYIRKSSNFVFC
jgi:hypothetical protein